MQIGDEVYVHGYVDEIRSDVVIIRNEGGYFGTVPSEITADRKTEPQMKACRECDDYAGDGMYCAKNHIVYDFDTCKDEPQTDCAWGRDH